MPTKCEECGKKSYIIYLSCELKKLCDKCYDKVRTECEFDPDDLQYRQRSV